MRHISALALTDTCALYGMPEFIRLCRKNDIRPIIGAEVIYAGGYELQLLVTSKVGYENLCALITSIQGREDRSDALARGVSRELLSRYAPGLLLLTGGINGPVDTLLRRGEPSQAESVLDDLTAIFGRERIFVSLEIRTEEDIGCARTIDTLAESRGLTAIATHDIHYLAPQDADKLRALRAMGTLTTIQELPQPIGLHFPDEAEMRNKFGWNQGALDAAAHVADMCDYVPQLGTYHFPSLGPGSGALLRQEAYAGMDAKYPDADERITARMEKELGVIITAGYADYFLIVADIVRYARESGVPVSPRGSGSSSLVSYCIGIHDVDPIYYNLYFERFLSLERLDPPDIDLDFSSDRRDEVILYVYKKYGADRVAMVCTFIRLQPRMAFHETAKAYGIPEKRIRELSRHLPMFYYHESPDSKDNKRKVDIIEYAENDDERSAIIMAKALEGIPHHLSVHPGGIVISPEPLNHFVPLQYARKGLLITQFDLTGISAIGLVKIDLLGVSSLTVASRCVKLIRRTVPDFSFEDIPAYDEKTMRMIASAETIGIFQIESPGLRLTLREINAKTKEDLIVAVCLYRPGPLKGGLKNAFIKRHQKFAASEYLHPALMPVLEETYGVILYQEQVIRIAHEVGGFTLGRADALRKAISRSTHKHLIRGMQEEFVAGAKQMHGIDSETAIKIWKLMEAFAGYGFPKAHAAAYGALANKIAYLKAHYPAEFMAARIAVPGGYYSQHFYMAEARRLGVTVRGPHVNHSRYVCELEGSTLWSGLFMVRDLTRKTIGRIIRSQPFKSFDDFLSRAEPLYKETQHLLKAGCLDGLAPYGEMRETLAVRWAGNHTAQMQFDLGLKNESGDTRSAAERMSDEFFLLRYSFTRHMLDIIPMNGHQIVRSSFIYDNFRKDIYLYGIPRASHKVVTANGTWKLLIDMEDQAGLFQVLADTPEANRTAKTISRRSLLLIHGRVKRTAAQSPIVVADTIAELDRISRG